MALWEAFCGGAYRAHSKAVADETAINVYVETREVPGSPKRITLYGTPGLVLEATMDSEACRGRFTQDGRSWVVVGGTLYERISAGGYTELGTIADDSAPVSFTSNGMGGDQLGIVGGGELKVLDLSSSVLSAAVALPFSDPVMLAFLDGYGLINQRNSAVVWFSALEDLTTWDALDFFGRSGTSDNIVGIAATKDRVWTLGSATTTQFYNSGDADTPFLPYPGTAVQVGLVNPWALSVHNDVLRWIAQSQVGTPRVVQATDPSVQTISTPPIAQFLGACATLDTAECMTYAQAGRTFFVMTCPGSPDAVNTYVFNVEEAEAPWHARAGWNSTMGVYTRWRARGVTVVDQTVLVGDYETGDLFTLELDAYDDDGAILKRERTAPYPDTENQWAFFDQAELGTQPGVGLSSGQGSAPVVDLEMSRDLGAMWVSAGSASLGLIGETEARTIWRHLGRVRQDRLVLRVTQTDPVQTVWTGMWLKFSAGTGQL